VSQNRSNRYQTLAALLTLTAGALLVQGYHPFAEDAEIYLPGVEKILHPQLFPSGTEFFLSHARLTFFPDLIAFSLRLTHLPMTAGLFAWQLASIFLLLLACWELSGLFFESARTRWGGVCLIAALLTIPVSGTALYIMDQYLNPRNLAAFASVFAVARVLEKKYFRALLWLAFAALVHPLMAVFPLSFCLLLLVMDKLDPHWRQTATAVALLLPWIPLAPLPSAAYHEVAKRHANHYIQNWPWYELLGIIAPMVLFWWFAKIARTRRWRNMERVSRAFIVYDLIYLIVAMAMDLPARFETLARIQPLRSLHLLYLVMFLMMGGLLAEYVLKNYVWRWLALFVPLSFGMFFAQCSLFPASAHIEWPGVAPKNPWAQAFLWIRQNTPVGAVFALDPEHMHFDGEDEIGFRGLAERSRLADWVKDNGAVSMFPLLGEEWWKQIQAQTPWKKFQLADFHRLRSQYGVSWVVVEQPGVAGLDCKYENAAVRVCQIP
jgi:hypothetical protein